MKRSILMTCLWLGYAMTHAATEQATIQTKNILPIITVSLHQVKPYDTNMKQMIATLWYLLPDSFVKTRIAKSFYSKFGVHITDIVTPIAEEELAETAKGELADLIKERDKKIQVRNKKAQALETAKTGQASLQAHLNGIIDAISQSQLDLERVQENKDAQKQEIQQLQEVKNSKASATKKAAQTETTLHDIIKTVTQDTDGTVQKIHGKKSEIKSLSDIITNFKNTLVSLAQDYQQAEEYMRADDEKNFESTIEKLKKDLHAYTAAASDLELDHEDPLVTATQALIALKD